MARADVLKARLVLQQSRRDLQDAVLAEQKARIAMAVLMFSDYRTDFSLVDDLDTVQPLPLYADIEILVKEKSPDLRAAGEAVRQEEIGVRVARTAYLPSLSFDYFYGINANRFAVRDEEGRNRLGSSAQATLDIPVWNWWTVRSKVRQADARRMQAELNLELTRKRLIGDLHALYLEAQAALAQLDLLRNSVDDAAESLRLTSLRYQAGEVSVLEVVDAQSTLVQARNAHDDGLARYRLAFEGIRTLTGAI